MMRPPTISHTFVYLCAVVESYILSVKPAHIYLDALCLIILLLSLLLLYKTLAPKPIQVEAPELTPHASVNILASLELQPPFLGVYMN